MLTRNEFKIALRKKFGIKNSLKCYFIQDLTQEFKIKCHTDSIRRKFYVDFGNGNYDLIEFIYLLFHGKVSNSIMKICENRNCINPFHLLSEEKSKQKEIFLNSDWDRYAWSLYLCSQAFTRKEITSITKLPNYLLRYLFDKTPSFKLAYSLEAKQSNFMFLVGIGDEITTRDGRINFVEKIRVKKFGISCKFAVYFSNREVVIYRPNGRLHMNSNLLDVIYVKKDYQYSTNASKQKTLEKIFLSNKEFFEKTKSLAELRAMRIKESASFFSGFSDL